MPVTTMDQPPEFLPWRETHIAKVRTAYPSVWHQMIEEWRSPGPGNRVWLMYSANYLFRTGNTRWALDPLTLHRRVPEAEPVNASADLHGLDFVLLTHRHADHLDQDVIRDLSLKHIQWVVPEDVLPLALGYGLDPKKIIVPKPLEPLELEGVRVTPFEGLHLYTSPEDPTTQRGVPAIGYLVEFSGKRWLFPGDVRTYDASRLPVFGPVDILFAHVCLGHGRALSQDPPWLDAFCSFCLALQPQRIVLTHLHELGRSDEDYWHEGHVQQVKEWFLAHDPDRLVEHACMGDRVDL